MNKEAYLNLMCEVSIDSIHEEAVGHCPFLDRLQYDRLFQGLYGTISTSDHLIPTTSLGVSDVTAVGDKTPSAPWKMLITDYGISYPSWTGAPVHMCNAQCYC